MTDLYSNGTNGSFPSTTDPNVSSAMIISFEVIFSISIFGIIIACYFIGIRRRNRLREARSREYETMVERALTRQQQQQYTPHHQYNIATDSSSTLGSNFYHHPPPYSPPASDPSCQQLSERDVSRLSQAMLTNHIIQSSQYNHTSCHLPRYADLVANGDDNEDHHHHQRQLHEHASTSIQTPPMAITRSIRTETDLITPKLPQE